jgi:general secretion pathway protein D
MMPYPATNTLIVTDVHSNINRLLTMLKTIDIPMTGRDITIFPLQYASADQLAKMLDSIFLPGNKSQRDDAIGTDIPFRCVAEDRTNSLVVLANDDYTRRVRAMIGTLDRETPKGNERMRVIYLEHARADDLVKVLQDMPGKTGEGEAAKSGRQSLLSGNVKITADKATNSLIITANKDEYTVLEDIVRQLDIPRSMVYIECLIMEVNVNKDFALGTEWVSMGTTDVSGRDAAFGGGFSGAGAYPGVGGLSPLDGTVGTLPGLAALVRAYRQDKDVNILSTPQILTTDNEEAIITVGKNVPYQTKSGSTGTLESFNTYEYRDVGITLKITPQISKDRMVRLNINQEVTKLDVTSESTTRLNAERPTTFKRTIATTVLVQDQRTVVIGGLIDDSFSETEYKTPCLGDIPGLGWLFKSLSTGREKTNLFVFLTPRVLQGPAESDRIYDIKKEQMDGIRQDNVKTP